jgi:hypothetical protein
LIGYDSNSNLSDFITVVDEGANTKLIIDHDGTGALNNLVTITPAAVSSFAQPRKVLSILFKVIEVLLNISVAFVNSKYPNCQYLG